MNESFRPRRSIQVEGILGVLLFLAAMIGSTRSALLDEPTKHGFEREHSVAVVVGLGLVVFGSMTLLSIYMLLAYYLERVAVAGTTIFVTTVFQKREFDAAEVDKLTWKTQPMGGRIDFCVANRRTKLELYGYSDEDRLQLIRLFRALIPEAKQADWPSFCQKIALPLRDRRLAPSAGTAACPPAEGEVVITRARYDRLAAVMLPASFVVAGVVWWATGSPVLLGTTFATAAGWLFLRYTVRREGERRVRLTAMPGHRYLLFYLAIMFGSFTFIGLLRLAGMSTEAACGAILLPAAPFLIYALIRANMQQDRDAQIATTAAPSRWNEGELARL